MLRCCTLLFVVVLAAVPLMAQGAESEPTFQVNPETAELHGPLSRLQIAATTTAKDSESPEDVTRDAVYECSTPNVATVDQRGQVKPLADGMAKIQVRWNSHTAEVELRVTGCNSPAPASFRRDVIPVLNRTGCTSGACHAAQFGQGGLKFSLLGFAPEQDYPPIARDRAQRRISLVRPEDSLLLQKPTLAVAHAGGRRFRSSSYEYKVLLAWLKDGAPKPPKNEPHVVDLAVSPTERVYRRGQSQQLRVVATYSDGAQRDVTCAAQYDSLGESVAQVDSTGYVTCAGPGQAAVMVRYLGQAKVSLAVSPYTPRADHEETLAGFEPRNFIDELVKKRWRRLGLSPAPSCSDETFVRRAFLDALGMLPPPKRIEEFLESEDPHRREALVDELLGLTGDPKRDQYVDQWSAYWTLKWGDLIRNNRNRLGDGGMWAMYNWFRSSLRENKPLDQFVRELITAEGSVFQSGPANYYKIASKPEDLAEATAQNFLGVRLQCARCHHHPFEVYSQADYYSLAAFFTRVATKSSSDFGALGGDTVVLVKRSGSIRHPRTRKAMTPTPLGGEPIDPEQHRDLRRPLAQWLTSGQNKLFARNMVNRFWGYLMGSGLVEPIDDMRATNPPSNPELLDALADYFVEQKFDLRKLMRAIMTSRVYQLSCAPRPKTETTGPTRNASIIKAENTAARRFYTRYNLKRLPAEVLLDTIDFACGVQEKFSGIPAGTRAVELPDPNYASYFLDTLGRPKRVITCECERTTAPNLAQILHLANGEVLSQKVAAKGGRIAKRVAEEMNDEILLQELYLCTVSRPPSQEEIERCQKIVSAAPQRKEGFEDVLWALCNSREFLFNH